MTEAHTDTNTLLSFIDDPSTLRQTQQLRIARHLTAGCATCWSAVDRLPSIQPFRPSDVALREALLHLSCNESRAILSADLVAALARARHPPTGFARLLLTEALCICLASKDGDGRRDPVCHDLVKALLEESDPSSPDLHDLGIQDQVHEALSLLQADRIEDADTALDSAEALATKGATGKPADPAVLVGLCEAQARRAWNRGELETAATCYSQAQARLYEETGQGEETGLCEETGPCPKWVWTRRFEIHGEIAILHGLRDNFTDMSRAETLAHEALTSLCGAGDPVLATGAVLRAAELTQRLAVLAPGPHPLRREGVRQAVSTLQEAADDFERFTDPLTRAQREYCLARLVLFFNPKEAVLRYRQAAESFRNCQADEHQATALSEGKLVHGLEKLTGAGVIDAKWTVDDIKSLMAVLLQLDESKTQTTSN